MIVSNTKLKNSESAELDLKPAISVDFLEALSQEEMSYGLQCEPALIVFSSNISINVFLNSALFSR